MNRAALSLAVSSALLLGACGGPPATAPAPDARKDVQKMKEQAAQARRRASLLEEKIEAALDVPSSVKPKKLKKPKKPRGGSPPVGAINPGMGGTR